MTTLAPLHARVPHALTPSFHRVLGAPLYAHHARRTRHASVVPCAMGAHEWGRLLVNVVTTGLALREYGLKRLPPSQLAASTAATAAGVGYAWAGLPQGQVGVDPTLVATAVYACYRAWQTHQLPPHRVHLRPRTKDHGGHDAVAQWVLLAALADGAARAGSYVGSTEQAAAAACLLPLTWWALREAGETQRPGAKAGVLLPPLAELPVRIGLGLVGALAATAAAERLGGPPAAVAMSMWVNAQIFPV